MFCEMEKILEEKHREICGVIIEPMVQAAAGMKIYSAKYLLSLGRRALITTST